MPLRPTASTRVSTPCSRRSRSIAIALRTMLALKAPARPRSPVMATTATVLHLALLEQRVLARLLGVGGEVDHHLDHVAGVRAQRLDALLVAAQLGGGDHLHGLVILRVFWTDAMRRLMSRRVATSGLRLRRLDLRLDLGDLGRHARVGGERVVVGGDGVS